MIDVNSLFPNSIPIFLSAILPLVLYFTVSSSQRECFLVVFIASFLQSSSFFQFEEKNNQSLPSPLASYLSNVTRVVLIHLKDRERKRDSNTRHHVRLISNVKLQMFNALIVLSFQSFSSYNDVCSVTSTTSKHSVSHFSQLLPSIARFVSSLCILSLSLSLERWIAVTFSLPDTFFPSPSVNDPALSARG